MGNHCNCAFPVIFHLLRPSQGKPYSDPEPGYLVSYWGSYVGGLGLGKIASSAGLGGGGEGSGWAPEENPDVSGNYGDEEPPVEVKSAGSSIPTSLDTFIMSLEASDTSFDDFVDEMTKKVSFGELYKAYPKTDGKMCNNPKLNECSIKMSLALERVGLYSEDSYNETGEGSARNYSTMDNKWAPDKCKGKAKSPYALADYIEKKLKVKLWRKVHKYKSNKSRRDNVRSMKHNHGTKNGSGPSGIVVYFNGWGETTGHITLWRNGSQIDTAIPPGASEVWFFEMD